MTYLRRTLVPVAFWTVFSVGCVAAVAGALWTVTKVHAARSAEQRVCAAELKAVKARNLYVERYLLPASPCEALRVLAGRTR